jgi:uncharacterized protein YciI
MPVFVQINEQGPRWVPGLPMREQAGWAEHAAFMNALEADRTVVLGGPIGGANRHRAMIVLEAESAEALRGRLAQDPWMRSGILAAGELLAWELLIGTLP